MNKCIFLGRLAADPELKTVQTSKGDMFMTYFSLAVPRPYNKNAETQEVDWIDFTAWRSTAEFICKYFKKGTRMLVEAKANARMVENQEAGTKRKSVTFQVENVEFVDFKSKDSSASKDEYADTNNSVGSENTQSYSNTDSADEDELPF